RVAGVSEAGEEILADTVTASPCSPGPPPSCWTAARVPRRQAVSFRSCGTCWRRCYDRDQEAQRDSARDRGGVGPPPRGADSAPGAAGRLRQAQRRPHRGRGRPEAIPRIAPEAETPHGSPEGKEVNEAGRVIARR